jgi:hypothetical protein
MIKLADYELVHVCRIEPILDTNGTVRKYLPQFNFANERSLPLNRYGAGPFCKFKIPNTYKTSGVYALTVDHETRYVGECENLSSRYNMGYGNISPRNCFKGGQETNCRLNNLIYNAALEENTIDLWFHRTITFKLAELDILAIQRWAWNRKWEISIP